ncbi:MAG: DUF2075 domain-containing protein [Phycisphaeraceae bacterium]|nr:DUF2075 domain-containing protein [Phycisphaeraceae bacterium]MBX3406532.1 DUF2075 domain-containing protein [Phycisphaeraceae bacterium]
MPERSYYSDTIAAFLARNEDEILGTLSRNSTFADEPTQKSAWIEQIRILKEVLTRHRGDWGSGKVYFEYDVPRIGKRIDVVAAIGHALFVLEFKVGETEFRPGAVDQVYDYALDLKHFHETSHGQFIAPVLVATKARAGPFAIAATSHDDGLLAPIRATPENLSSVIVQVLALRDGPVINAVEWEQGRYCPTPTIVEAALALYGGHSVESISRSDAGAINLTHTSESISIVIRDAQANRRKAICFVTGVPGAGKTLVGLNIATKHSDRASAQHSVFLSGNGPLVRILCEALARDKVRRLSISGTKGRLGVARSEVRAFIQNVHHFRDECLRSDRPPVDRVVLFDEAQRAWNRKQTASFMQRKRGHADFTMSEPEFLISCMDRHPDWAVIVCLVGGGQEINTGEAGIGEWIESLNRSFPHWDIHISPRLHDSEYGAGGVLAQLDARPNVAWNNHMHLSVSMRSFRAENVSAFVKAVLDRERSEAQRLLDEINAKFPIVLTRDLKQAKGWLRDQARGTERYGLVVSSQALRLKPHAIDVRSPTDPVHWFLDPKDDVRSSYYLEDAATEFDVQGLELDWTGVVWDGDFRPTSNGSGWSHHSFVGARWNRINKPEIQTYLKNAYRVLLTRARQGMVIVVPESDPDDPTRAAEIYDPTFEYLRSIGIKQL